MLAPPPAVGGLPDPPPPEVARLVEQRQHFIGMEVPRTRSRCGLEYQTADFTGARGNDRMDALVVMGDVCLLVGADIRAAREGHRGLEPIIAGEGDALGGG